MKKMRKKYESLFYISYCWDILKHLIALGWLIKDDWSLRSLLSKFIIGFTKSYLIGWWEYRAITVLEYQEVKCHGKPGAFTETVR